MAKETARIGLICVGLEGEHVELAERFHAEAKQKLPWYGVEIVNAGDGYTLRKEDVLKQARACRDNGAAAVVYLIGTWILADHIVDAVQDVGLPVGVWGIPEPISFSSVGANVVRGALGEMGIPHRLFYGLPDEETVLREIGAYASACRIKKELRGMRMGVIGGKAISAYPTTADPNQIKALFGVEVDHIDQLVLLEKARAIPAERSRQLMETVRATYGVVDVPDEILLRSVNTYAALKCIIEENGLGMCAVKCIGEYMDAYGSCCLALSMLNDEGYTVVCQGNINALLSAKILSYLSEDPVYFGDINMVDKQAGTARLINCGSIPGRLAPDYESITIKTQYEYMGKGRGACTLFCCKEGSVTFGTLGRENGKYVMGIATGEGFTQPMDVLCEVRDWAQGFVRLDGDPMDFYRNIRSNHCTACYGDCAAELKEFCGLMGIATETN